MTYQQVYKTHYSRIVRESILKSAIFGLLSGVGVSAVIAFITIFTEFNGLWTAIGVGLGVAAIATVVLYFTLFRPTEQKVAERLDRLGFDERIITMRELEGDSSLMATMQRYEAITAVTRAAELNGGKIPAENLTVRQRMRSLGLNAVMLVVMGVVAAFAVVSLTLTSMPQEKVKELFTGPRMHSVSIDFGEHGYGIGGSDSEVSDSSKTVAEAGKGEKLGSVRNAKSASSRDKKYTAEIESGKSLGMVTACANDAPDDPYMFVGWSDGYYDEYNAASRTDKVTSDIKATALYERIETVEDDPEEGLDGSGDNPGGQNGNQPPQDGSGEAPKGNGEPNDGPQGTGATASDTELNGEIKDGKTDYQECMPEYYEEAMRRLAEGKDIPESLRKLIAAYYEALK